MSTIVLVKREIEIMLQQLVDCNFTNLGVKPGMIYQDLDGKQLMITYVNLYDEIFES